MICINCSYGNALNIIVATNGTNSPDCLKDDDSTKPCGTLDFVLSNIGNLECDKKLIMISVDNGTYDYSLNATKHAYQFWHCQNISIVGKGNNLSSINCTEPGAGFAFFNSTEVMIKDISIRFCGSSQNGTSYDSTTNTSSMVRAALYFAFCHNVNIIGSVVEQSNNTGVVVYNTDQTLNVINSKFMSNRNTENAATGGGGFYAEFTYCHPGFTENCVQYSNSGANYMFEGSEFSHNEASDGLEKFNTFIRANGTDNVAFGRGGGISLLFKGNVTKSNVTVNKCKILSNKATWGAGLFIEFQDNSNQNRVFIKDSVMNNNSCELNFDQNYGTGGGGARVGFISFTKNSVQYNTITFKRCNFTNNIAYWGGGLSYYTFRERNTTDATNNLSFTNCSWESNIAVLGSAIDLSVWHPIKNGVLSKVLFFNCEFCNNTNDPKHTTYYKESSLGTGAFYSDSIPVAFQYVVKFENNDGSALALSATSATFKSGCKSSFVGNSGWTGGAIALLGNAWLKIYDQTKFNFHKNSAILNGGAISVVISSRHDLLSSRNCFLQYYDQFVGPQNWNTSFNFTNNTAPKGYSIFATSLLSCVWGNSTGQLSNSTSTIPFHNWTFLNINSSDMPYEISTEISKIMNTNATLTIAPGQLKNLPLTYTNDFNTLVNDSIYLLPDNQNISVVNNLTAENKVALLGPKDSTFTFKLKNSN